MTAAGRMPPGRPLPGRPPGSLAAAAPRLEPAGRGPGGGAGRGPGSGARSAHSGGSRPPGRPEPRRLARVFAEIYCEVEAGRRTPAQAAALLTPQLYARLATGWVRGGHPAVLRVVVAQAAEDACEAVALIRRGRAVGAVGFRLARLEGGWRVTDLALPERGPLPPPAWPVPGEERDAFVLVLGEELAAACGDLARIRALRAHLRGLLAPAPDTA